MQHSAVYIRVSTEEQANEGFSIESQKHTIEEYADKHGMEIVDFYIDKGKSGSSIKKRTELQRLLKDSTAKKFSNVLIAKVDRLSRNSKDSAWLLQHFDDYEIKLISLKENIDLSSTSGRTMYQIVSTFAEFERNKLIENVKTGMKEKAEEGFFLGGVILGYDSIDKSLVINKEESTIVRFIFYLNAAGWRKIDIAHFLNLNGFKTKRNNAFKLASITSILKNRMYIGELNYQFKDIKITNYLENLPIIENRFFNLCQNLFDTQTSNFSDSNFLTNILRCPDCNGPMVRACTNNKGKTLRYYTCDKRRKGFKCTANSIQVEKADNLVIKELEKALDNLSRDSYFKSIWIQLLKENPINEMKELFIRQAAKIEKRINQFDFLLQNKQIEFEQIKTKYGEWKLQKNSLESSAKGFTNNDENSNFNNFQIDINTFTPKVLNLLSNVLSENIVVLSGKPSQRSLFIQMKNINQISDKYFEIACILYFSTILKKLKIGDAIPT
jgi:site-specific DNA recombinase